MADAGSPDAKGFFKSLYDFKFESLIAERFLRFIYKLAVIVLTIVFVLVFISVLAGNSDSLNSGVKTGLVIGVPLWYFAILISMRIGYEFLIVFFQIGDNVRAIRRGGLSPAELAEVSRQSIPIITVATEPLAVPSTPAVASSPAAASTPAGWYDAPGDPSQYRYWDGKKWTEQYSPKGGSA